MCKFRAILPHGRDDSYPPEAEGEDEDDDHSSFYRGQAPCSERSAAAATITTTKTMSEVHLVHSGLVVRFIAELWPECHRNVALVRWLPWEDNLAFFARSIFCCSGRKMRLCSLHGSRGAFDTSCRLGDFRWMKRGAGGRAPHEHHSV